MTNSKNYNTKQIDGLRGYLAVMVAIGHAFESSGYFKLPFHLAHIFINGGFAVNIFIIISGFVITHLILTRNESYTFYITRRFFRLFPVYALACIFGYFLSKLSHEIVIAPIGAGGQDYVKFVKYNDEIYLQETKNIIPHILAHLTLMHGMIPRQLLPDSAVTFLSPAWSISLEWQFYIIAPFIISSLKKSFRGFFVIAAFLILYYLYEWGYLGVYTVNDSLNVEASIAHFSPLFAVGIGSRFAFPFLKRLELSPIIIGMSSIFMLIIFGKMAEVLIFWAIFFSFLLWHENAPKSGALFQIITASKFPIMLGEISYCIYLIHPLIQEIGLIIFASREGLSRKEFLLVELSSTFLTIGVAYLVHTSIEVPGQKLGKKIASSFMQKSDSTAQI